MAMRLVGIHEFDDICRLQSRLQKVLGVWSLDPDPRSVPAFFKANRADVRSLRRRPDDRVVNGDRSPLQDSKIGGDCVVMTPSQCGMATPPLTAF